MPFEMTLTCFDSVCLAKPIGVIDEVISDEASPFTRLIIYKCSLCIFHGALQLFIETINLSAIQKRKFVAVRWLLLCVGAYG